MAVVGAITAISSLGYGIYAGQQAKAEQQREYNQARSDAQTQQAQQAAMLKDQQAQQTALAAQQQQQQAATVAQQQQAQKDALAGAQAQIPVIQGQLSQSLANSQQQAMSQQEPLIEGRLNALGLLNSGALPAQQAQYQAQLASQAQQELANYGTSANQNIQNQALAYTGTDTANLQNNLQQTLQNQQAALNQQFSGQDTAYQNDVAQSQYLSNLQAAMTASQQAQANQIVNFGGQIGQGAIANWGKSPATQTPTTGINFSTPTAFDLKNTGYTASGAPFSTQTPQQSYGMFDSYGNYVPQGSAVNYKPYTGGVASN